MSIGSNVVLVNGVWVTQPLDGVGTGGDGATGATGPAGATGPQGPSGVPGSGTGGSGDGSTGATGPAGPAGATGPVGSTGPAGSTGVQGPTGVQGALGPPGANGATGATGAGATGATGPFGGDGPVGATGADGTPGTIGATGATGPAGASGPVGAEGINWMGLWDYATTYEVDDAVSYGGASWIATAPSTNLPCPDHPEAWDLFVDRGQPGPAGATGPVGADGVDGTSGTDGASGATGATGPAGTDGADGTDGTAGSPGAVGATGPAGAAGPSGQTGASGPAGASGLPGQTGATGPQGTGGTAGLPGVDGATGPVGATGPSGATGSTGPVGASGASAGMRFYPDPTSTSDIATYKKLMAAPSGAAEATVATVCTGTADVLVGTFATDPGVPGVVDFPAGTATRTIYAMVSAGTARLHLMIYKRTEAGVETLVRDEFSDNFSNLAVAAQQWTVSASSGGSMLAADRIVAKIYAQRVSGSTSITVTTFYEGTSHTSTIQTTISSGSVGAPGATGATGAAGATGVGATGPAGPSGVTGAMGPAGAAGASGVGATGATGPDGGVAYYEQPNTPAEPLPAGSLWLDTDEPVSAADPMTPGRLNYVSNSSFEVNANNWSQSGGTGGVATLLRTANATPPVADAGGFTLRQTFTTGTTAPSGSIYFNLPGMAITPNLVHTASLYVRSNKIQRVCLRLTWRTAAGVDLTPVRSPDVVLAANTWTRLSVTDVAPATAAYVRVECEVRVGTGAANWAVNDWIEIDAALLEQSASLGSYFDGAMTGYQFMGSVHGSPSQEIRLVSRFVANGTWIKPAGVKTITVEVCSGGGGGGGVPTTATTSSAAAAGGCGGGYARHTFLPGELLDTESVVVGAGGAGGSGAANGSPGGLSSFGSKIVVNGGGGGDFMPSGATVLLTASNGGGAFDSAASTIQPHLVSRGEFGLRGMRVSGTFAMAGVGGASFLGQGGPGAAATTSGSANGSATSAIGGGGAGAQNINAQVTAANGGNGGPGIVIVTCEF